MINIEKLTDEQQLSLAEFAYSLASDILIKSDGEKVITVFQEHSVPEAFVANLEIDDICDLIEKNISTETLEIIMGKYYSGKL